MLKVKGKEITINREDGLVKNLEACIIRGNRRLAIEDALLLSMACHTIEAENIVEIGDRGVNCISTIW
jgi:hypothetical protein